MATETDSIVQYGCTRCDALLETRSSQLSGWVRCPRCGGASLPPEHLRRSQSRKREPAPTVEDVPIVGPEKSGLPAAGRSPFGPGSFRRIAGATGMFVSLLIALLSLLEQDRISATVFALIALACLTVATYPVRPRMA